MSLSFHNLVHVVMAVAVATASPPAGAGGPSSAAVDEPQVVAARLSGTWDCAGSAPGSRSKHTYRAAGDTKLVLEAHVHTSFGVDGDVTETFAYDRASGVWTLVAGRNRFFDSMRLTAQAWTGNAWLLTGTQTTNGVTRVARIAYGAAERDSFVRQLQSWTNGRWTDDGTLTCRRVGRSVALRAAVPAAKSPSPASAPSPSARPSMQPAVAVIPRHVNASPTPTPTPLPIPGILPAEAPSARPSPTPVAHVRASAAPVRPSARPSESPAAAPRPSAAHIVTAPPRTAPRPSATPAQATDLAYRLTGKWACETLGGAPATHEYSVQGDGTLKLHNVLTIAKHDFGIDETYRFDRTKNVWTTQTGSGAYVGTAPKWLSGKWVFEGSVPSDKGRVPVQMIYSTLGEGAFRRDFAKLQDGSWKTFAAETCHRP